jgi:hypothetical protein
VPQPDLGAAPTQYSDAADAWLSRNFSPCFGLCREKALALVAVIALIATTVAKAAAENFDLIDI